MNNSIAPGSSADVNVNVTALTTNLNVPVQYKTIILKKNLVNGVNTLTQEMMSTANTKYLIKYDYVLGEDITVPENCVLGFDGGSLNNGSIYGNETRIENKSNGVIFDNVVLKSNGSIGNVQYKGWLGYCCDLWFAYNLSSKAHYDIVASVCKFQFCEFRRSKYYIEKWETIFLRIDGFHIEGNGVKFILTSNKGASEQGDSGETIYTTLYLFYKNPTGAFIGYNDDSSESGDAIIKNITILDNKDVINETGWGEDITIPIRYIAFHLTAINVTFINCNYDGNGEFYGDYNRGTSSQNTTFVNCNLKSNFFCIEMMGLQDVGTSYKGSYNTITLDNCKFYNFKDRVYVGQVSFVDGGSNREGKISSPIENINITNCVFDSEKLSCPEIIAKHVRINNCCFYGTGINSEFVYDTASQTIVSDEYIITNNLFAASKNYKTQSGQGCKLSGHNVIFIGNTFISSGDMLGISFVGKNDSESIVNIVNNSFIFENTPSEYHTFIVCVNNFVTMQGNKYVFNSPVSSWNLKRCGSFTKHGYLDILDNRIFDITPYTYGTIPDAYKDADGYLIENKQYQLDTTYTDAESVHFRLNVKLNGQKIGESSSIITLTGNGHSVSIETTPHQERDFFYVKVDGTNKYTGPCSISSPCFGLDRNCGVGKIDIVLTNHYNSQETTCLLFVNDVQMTYFSLDTNVLGSISNIVFTGSPYCRIKDYIIGNAGYIVTNPKHNPTFSLEGNNGFPKSGTTRPTNVPIGYEFFDTTSGIEKPIYYKGKVNNADVWVDATGTTV